MSDAPMADASETVTAMPICACGATERHATAADRCVRGHVLIGNQERRTHGAYAFRERGDAVVADDLRISADDMAARVIADKGGTENCPTLLREYIQQARNIRVMLDLLGNDIVKRGLFTPKGRVRNTFTKWLETLDRFDRFATKIGLDREARRVLPIEERLAAMAFMDGIWATDEGRRVKTEAEPA